MQDITGGDHAPGNEDAPAPATLDDHAVVPEPQPSTGNDGMGFRDWLREGLRAGLFLKPRVTTAEPTAGHLLAIVLAITALHLAMQRLTVQGPANFNLRGWLTPWWTTTATVLVVWSLFSFARRTQDGRTRGGTAAWFVLVFVASLPLALVYMALGLAWDREWMPSSFHESAILGWGMYALLWAWDCALGMRIASALGLRARALAALGVALLALNAVASWQFQDRAWYPAREDDGESAPRFTVSQEVFESQQALRERSLAALLPQRPGVADVYGIVFAPYASEDVFLRESTMVAGVLHDRFDAGGRLLQLVNHQSTTDTLPWATPANLQRAIAAVAAKMDRSEDVLVVYLTSHGASNFQLAANHWPLEVPRLTPEVLRKALDDAGVRHRVVAVSACFSGGWVDPLADEDTLVMTAADATHTSYGCGRKSQLTFFGRAVFDEGLRRTHSFEDAFAAAVPVIRQREIEGKKPDGFSNPQIRVGAKIRPVLAEVAKRLDSRP